VGRRSPGGRRWAPSRPEMLRVLSAVLTAMRDAGEYPDVLGRICAALTETVPCDRATIYVYSRRRRAFLPAADHGTRAEVVQAFIERGWAPGAFPLEAELRAGRAINVARAAAPPALEEVLQRARRHGVTVLPLAFGRGAEGALACGVDRPPALGPKQVALLAQIVPHIAVLIQNARLQVETARLAERRARLASSAAEVLGAPDFAEMER